MATGKLERPPNDNQFRTFRDVVQWAVHERNVMPDRLWDMSVQDLCLFIAPPEDNKRTVTNSIEGQLVAAEIDERIARVKALSIDERLELERWKAELM